MGNTEHLHCSSPIYVECFGMYPVCVVVWYIPSMCRGMLSSVTAVSSLQS